MSNATCNKLAAGNDDTQIAVVRVELSWSGKKMYRHVSQHGELRRESFTELMEVLQFVYGDCTADLFLGEFDGGDN